MAEAIFNNEKIIEVSNANVQELIEHASTSPRHRFRLCLHNSLDDQIQEMLIVIHRDTYLQPHRHPERITESYHMVQGEMTVFHFDEAGKICRIIEMGEKGSGKTFLYRLARSVWHTVVPHTEYAVYHETFTGPFAKDKVVEYATWSPEESDLLGIEKFRKEVLGG